MSLYTCCACFRCLVTKSCPTLWDRMDYSPPAPPSMGFPRQEYWEWGTISFSRGSSWSRDWTHLSCLAGCLPLSHQGSPLYPLSRQQQKQKKLREVGNDKCWEDLWEHRNPHSLLVGEETGTPLRYSGISDSIYSHTRQSRLHLVPTTAEKLIWALGRQPWPETQHPGQRESWARAVLMTRNSVPPRCILPWTVLLPQGTPSPLTWTAPSHDLIRVLEGNTVEHKRPGRHN